MQLLGDRSRLAGPSSMVWMFQSVYGLAAPRKPQPGGRGMIEFQNACGKYLAKGAARSPAQCAASGVESRVRDGLPKTSRPRTRVVTRRRAVCICKLQTAMHWTSLPAWQVCPGRALRHRSCSLCGRDWCPPQTVFPVLCCTLPGAIVALCQ